MPKVTIPKDVAVKQVLEELEFSKKLAEQPKPESIKLYAEGRAEALDDAIKLVKLWLEGK
jgi:hypothetical protein